MQQQEYLTTQPLSIDHIYDLMTQQNEAEEKATDTLLALMDAYKKQVTEKKQNVKKAFSAYTKNGDTLMHCAARRGLTKALKKLHEEMKVSVNIVQQTTNETPLHATAYSGAIGTLLYLLIHKADTDTQNINGYTPLHIAIHCNKIDLCHLLCTIKALNKVDQDGNTALHWAAMRNNLELGRLFARAGAPIAQLNDANKTARELANKPEMWRCLEALGPKHVEGRDDGKVIKPKD
jgi:ankyrin repeat protein